ARSGGRGHADAVLQTHGWQVWHARRLSREVHSGALLGELVCDMQEATSNAEETARAVRRPRTDHALTLTRRRLRGLASGDEGARPAVVAWPPRRRQREWGVRCAGQLAPRSRRETY